ncbi:voltage-gated chloride channel protein, partial [Acinetobacter baumannii]
MKSLPSSEYDQILKYSVYWLVISIVIGVVAGLASTLIFVAFYISNKIRSLHHWL